MQLRTRICLLGIIVVIMVNIAIVFAAVKREDLIRLQFSNEIIADQSKLWNQVKEEFIERMEDQAWIMSENRILGNALADGDTEELQQIASQISEKLRNEEIADRFDLIYPDGTLAYSSHSGVFQSPIIVASVARDAIADQEQVRGIGNDKQRNTAIVFGTPLRSDSGQVVGLGVYATNIVDALADLEKSNNSSVMIVNRRGRLLVAPNSDTWNQFSDTVNLNEISELQTISDQGHFYSVLVLPQIANLGGLVARLVNIKDVTHLVLQQRKISQIIAMLIIVFVILSMLGLYLYMSRSFSPLTEGVNVLNALSKGDLQIQIEHATRKDEVGQIANAVNVFRDSMIQFNRFRRSHERQRARQERFIYREMTRLADTMDEGEDRSAILDELDHLGQIVQNEVEDGDNQNYAIMNAINEGSRSKDSDSLALMAVAFQSMSNRIQDQHQRLRNALATKEAFISLRKELDIATRVQLSLLPGHIETSDAFDIFGGMWPAKEVGGDFFDYFRLDEHRIGVAIADVSGKGVPAALFTVMARTILRGSIAHLDSPGKILQSVNDFLANNNDEDLFVTFFYGILDERTGRLTYSNCGHNPPIVSDKNGSRPLKLTNGMVLAMFSDIEFEDGCVDLLPGSRLVMFTDGIPEAFNAEEEAYGDDRLLDTVDALPEQDPADDVKQIVNSVNDFVKDAPQFDDIACVVMHFKEKLVINDRDSMNVQASSGQTSTDETTLSLALKCDLSELARSAEEIEKFGANRDWPPEWIFKTNLALDELITNVVNYGFEGQEEKKDIHITLTESDNCLVVVMEDEGNPFDPFSEAAEPSLDDELEERTVGGLGVYFVKTLMDEATYERREGRNHITLILHTPD